MAKKQRIDYPHINEKYVTNTSKLQGDCDQYFNAGMNGKLWYMIQWIQNINFLANNQWVTYDPTKRIFEISPNVTDEERITINKILPAFRSATASILRERIRPKVLQMNEDEQSIDSAKVATKMLDHLYRTTDMVHLEKELVEWAAICGKGINKKWYDPDTDKIVNEIIQPFEFITAPNVRKFDKMPWICHARYETLDWVYQNYGVVIDPQAKKDEKNKVRTSPVTDFGTFTSFLSVVKHVMSDGYLTGNTATYMANNVLVKEFWIRPNADYPKGLLAIFINDILIFADKNPISQDDDNFYMPFNEMDFFDLPFRYWGMSLIEPVIGLQTYYNKFQSYALENFKYAGAPVIIGPEGSVNQDEIIMAPGSFIPYTPNMGAKPEFLNPMPLSPQHFQVVNELAGNIAEIVGIRDFGQGSVPAGVHAAAALAIINEQDQTNKMPIVLNLEKFIRRDAYQSLYLIKKFWKQKTKIRVIGEENRWEVVEFNKDTLTGDEEIDLESRQQLAQDKMTRFDQIMKLMSTPRLDNPKEPLLDTTAGLRLLELENEIGHVDLESLNWNQAKDENVKLAKGEDVEVYVFENHKAHIEAHLQFMLRVDFKNQPDNVKQTFFAHYEAHKQMLAQQEQGQQPSINAMGGQIPQNMVQLPPTMSIPQGQMSAPQGQPPVDIAAMQQAGLPNPNEILQNQTATGLSGNLQAGLTNVFNQIRGKG